MLKLTYLCGRHLHPRTTRTVPVRYTEKVDCWSAGVIMCRPKTQPQNDTFFEFWRSGIFRELVWCCWGKQDKSFRQEKVANLMHLLVPVCFGSIHISISPLCWVYFLVWKVHSALGDVSFQRRVLAKKKLHSLSVIHKNGVRYQWNLGGGFKYFLFSSLFGEMIQLDEHIFQRGWFNHQPEHPFFKKPTMPRWFLGPQTTSQPKGALSNRRKFIMARSDFQHLGSIQI